MSDAVAATMQSPADGSGCYGIAIKGNYFGIVYNKAIFEECGITEFPSTVSAMKDACEKISAAELVSGFENGTAKAAMVLGQGAWIEADVLSIDPDIQIGFSGILLIMARHGLQM